MELSPRIEKLKSKIVELYEAKDPNRGDWADWLYESHIFVVAEYAGQLADRYGAKKDLVMAAGMLHDVADAVMRRDNPAHEERSLEIARSFLNEAGFSEEEIAIVVDDAIKLHSCYEGSVPVTLEGKVMATGDALGHLKTNFYDQAISLLSPEKTMEEIRVWGLPKIDRDYFKKIHFDEVRLETTPDYERVKSLFT